MFLAIMKILKRLNLFVPLMAIMMLSCPVVSCDKGDGNQGQKKEQGGGEGSGGTEKPDPDPEPGISVMPDGDAQGNVIPDFSRVGYHWGDSDIPSYAVCATLSPDGENDATAMIQAALDAAPEKGAVLLKAGKYYCDGTLTINRPGVVLRGEGAKKTIIVVRGTEQKEFLTMGVAATRTLGAGSEIKPYTPVGQLYVQVEDPGLFAKGDVVSIYRPATEKWIHDLHMDEIPADSGGALSTQWTTSLYSLYWDRTVTAVEGNKVYLDNPVVMALDPAYGGGTLYKSSWNRISECGVEDIAFESTYKSETDESHAWVAINITGAEHCWVRNFNSSYFGLSCVCLDKGSKNVTVTGCNSYSPVSKVEGSRRYAFKIAGGQLCLVKNCSCESDRHQFVTGARDCGPNVFLYCDASDALADAGPHQRWATGTLYDNVSTDKEILIQDRAYMGSGHGWAGANIVLWNCKADKRIVVQSPWVSAKNFAVGCIGTREEHTIGYGSLGPRLPGEWISEGSNVTSGKIWGVTLEGNKSLYETQLAQRNKAGIRIL